MSSKEAAELGEHCSFKECNRLDFLPIKCTKCFECFCKEHFSLTNHNCPKWQKEEKSDEPVVFKSAVNAFTCSLAECRTKDIVEFRCEFCNENFCKIHRLQCDHDCSKLQSKAMAKEEAKKEVKEFKFEMKQNVSAKNQSLAAKLIVMKLRKTASGPPGLPEESKFYCFVQYKMDKQPFFSSLKWPIGKFIEFIFDKLKISKALITKKKLFLKNRVVDSSLTCEEFISRESLSHGAVFELKEI